MFGSRWFWKLLLFVVLTTILVASCVECLTLTTSPPKVRVCQNKHCCKNNPQLLQTIANLLGASQVESSGCLSHCEKGPNFEIIGDGGNHDTSTTKLVHGVVDATTAVAQLELALEEQQIQQKQPDRYRIPKLLIAANNVMEKAVQSSDPSEQERFLTSVINKLQKEDNDNMMTALAHARALRANAYLEQHEWDLAIQDSEQAVLALKRNVATPATITMAYRVWADAEQQRPQAPLASSNTDNTRRAIAVLQQWEKAQPTYRSKVQREIQQLVLLEEEGTQVQ